MTKQQPQLKVRTRCPAVVAKCLRTDRKMASFEAHRSPLRSPRAALQRHHTAADHCDTVQKPVANSYQS